MAPKPSVLERAIPLSAAFNVRDVGGHRTADGSMVRLGRLYRGDSLHQLSPDDAPVLARLGLRTVIDLRTEVEVGAWGICPPAILDVEPTHLPLIRRTWDPDVGRHESAATFLTERYLAMLHEGGEVVGRILRLLSTDVAYPAYIHCAIGKDRTGVVVALLLALLGVSDRDIADDYALSDAAVADLVRWAWETHPDHRDAMERVPAVHLAAPPTAILLFLDVVRQQHGSVHRCVEQLGISPIAIERIRAHLLEPAS